MTTIRGPLPESPRPDYPWQGNDLSQREVDMLRLAETGDQLYLDKGPFDLPAMQNWGPERTIRAAALRQLLIGQQWPVDPKGVRLRGLRISGRLDLEAATLRCPLHLEDCYLDGPGPVVLDYATVSLLTFMGCYLAGLAGKSLTVTKDLDLTGSTFTGPLRLISAGITGSLNCSGAQLTAASHDGNALAASRMKAGNVSLDGWAVDGGVQPFTAAGTIDLTDAEITGFLSCTGGLADGLPGGNALAADHVKVGGDMSFDGVVAEAGALRLAAANIVGLLNCRGAQLTGADTDGNALVAYQIKAGNVWLDGQDVDGAVVQPFTAAGTIDLTDAEITGSLSCAGARLTACRAVMRWPPAGSRPALRRLTARTWTAPWCSLSPRLALLT